MIELAAVGAAGFAAGAGAALVWARRRESLRARYLSFVAHEINTPVSALNMTILNFVNGLFGPVPPEQMQWLVLIREQVARLGSLVGDLRDFVHVEFHRDLRLNREAVQLPVLLSHCVEGMKDAISRSGGNVESVLSTDLPAVDADPDRLGRALTAVLTHARKFRTSGSISVAAAADPAEVTLSFEYRGQKLTPDLAAESLDLFYPVYHPESQVLASVGLGLGLPCRLIEAHGGGMTLGVDPEGLCRIALRLPRWRPGGDS